MLRTFGADAWETGQREDLYMHEIAQAIALFAFKGSWRWQVAPDRALSAERRATLAGYE